jgi:hypothetical protein
MAKPWRFSQFQMAQNLHGQHRPGDVYFQHPGSDSRLRPPFRLPASGGRSFLAGRQGDLVTKS